MLVAEALLRKKCVDRNIDDIRDHMKKVSSTATTNASMDMLVKLITALDEYLDESQRLKMCIAVKNTTTEVDINGSTLTADNAVRIKDTIENKLDAITEIIDSSNGSLNIISLIKQRDQLLEQFIIMNNAINLADWDTSLD